VQARGQVGLENEGSEPGCIDRVEMTPSRLVAFVKRDGQLRETIWRKCWPNRGRFTVALAGTAERA
jgi:hypothetical protein